MFILRSSIMANGIKIEPQELSRHESFSSNDLTCVKLESIDIEHSLNETNHSFSNQQMSLLSKYEEYGSNDLICSDPDPNEMETKQQIKLNETGLVASRPQNSSPSTSSYEANSLNDFTCIKPEPDDMEYNVNKISQGVSNHYISLKSEVKEEMIYCQFCPFNDVALDRLKFHTFTQHPTGAAVVKFGESDHDIKFFCVKETCNFSTTVCTAYEDHLMNCCPLHQTLSGKEKERLKSTLQFAFDFHNKHCLSDITGLVEYFSAFNKAYRSDDEPVILRKHMEHNDSLSVVSSPSSLSDVPSSIDFADGVGRNEEGGFSSVSKPVPVFILQNQNTNLIESQTRMSGNTSSSGREQNDSIERLFKIGPSKVEIRKSHSHVGTQTGKKNFSCGNCDKRFQYRSDFLKHVKTHTGERPFRCGVCGKQFTTSSILNTHKKTHTGETPFKCNVCDKSFSVPSGLMRHKRTHTGDKPFKCDLCDKTFSTSSCVNVHKRTHTGEKPFKCSTCDKRFTAMATLIRHKRTHTGDKPFKCDLCDKTFAAIGNLIRHKRTHTGDKPFKCDLCDKTFSASSGLNVHKRTHTGDKPFKCHLCDKAYTSSKNLNAHKRTHTGEKTFKFNMYDDEGFADSSSPVQLKRTHTGENAYDEYNLCHNSLIIHKRTHIGEMPFKCNECDKNFTSSGQLISHKRTHTGDRSLKCDLCDKEFTWSRPAVVLKSLHTDVKSYICNICDLKNAGSGDLIIHKTTHASENYFTCNICDKNFSRSSVLLLHKRITHR